MCLEAVTEGCECRPPDEGLLVVDDALVEDFVEGRGREEGVPLDELGEETAGLQPALVHLPAQLLLLLLAVQTGPDIQAVDAGQRLRPLLAWRGRERETTRAELQSEVVEPALSHQVVDQVLLLLQGALADLSDVEVCVGWIPAGLPEETIIVQTPLSLEDGCIYLYI